MDVTECPSRENRLLATFSVPHQRRHLNIVHAHHGRDGLKTHPYKLFDTPGN